MILVYPAMKPPDQLAKCVFTRVAFSDQLGRSYSIDIYVEMMGTSYNKLLDLVFETRSPELEQ
jgi:hypothetical protein